MNVVETAHRFIAEFNGEVSLAHPGTCSFKKSHREVVIDQQGAPRHEHRVELVAQFTLDKRLEHADGPAGFVIVDLIDNRRGGRLLKIRDDDTAYALAKFFVFDPQNVGQGLGFSLSVRKDSPNR